MFTGIIEERGKLVEIKKGANSVRLKIECSTVIGDVKLGDSIAVNGVCLTVVNFDKKFFEADVMHETISKSSLGKIHVGDWLNLERAMPINGRFGGHIVSGHIDGTGIISSIKKDDIAIWFEIEADQKIMKYIINKGSICIDGISLTVAKVYEKRFYVSIIPHTISETTLEFRKVGDIVNIENDQIGKYVEKLFSMKKSESESKITKEFLMNNGF
ncbi:MAG: riboflavin synthase [Anaerovoracaceae bacterium]